MVVRDALRDDCDIHGGHTGIGFEANVEGYHLFFIVLADTPLRARSQCQLVALRTLLQNLAAP